MNQLLHESSKIFNTFLDNGNVPMDNNCAEQAIRPFTIGQKNWVNMSSKTEPAQVLFFTTSLRSQELTI